MLWYAADNIKHLKEKAEGRRLWVRAKALMWRIRGGLSSILGNKKITLKIDDLSQFLDARGQLAHAKFALADFPEAARFAEESMNFQQLELDKLNITEEATESARKSFLAACSLAIDACKLKNDIPGARKIMEKALIFINIDEDKLRLEFLNLLHGLEAKS